MAKRGEGAGSKAPVAESASSDDGLTFDELISDLREAEKNLQVKEPEVERKVGG